MIKIEIPSVTFVSPKKFKIIQNCHKLSFFPATYNSKIRIHSNQCCKSFRRTQIIPSSERNSTSWCYLPHTALKNVQITQNSEIACFSSNFGPQMYSLNPRYTTFRGLELNHLLRKHISPSKLLNNTKLSQFKCFSSIMQPKSDHYINFIAKQKL